MEGEKLSPARQDHPSWAAIHPGGQGPAWHHTSQDTASPGVLSSKPSLDYDPQGIRLPPSVPSVG